MRRWALGLAGRYQLDEAGLAALDPLDLESLLGQQLERLTQEVVASEAMSKRVQEAPDAANDPVVAADVLRQQDATANRLLS